MSDTKIIDFNAEDDLSPVKTAMFYKAVVQLLKEIRDNTSK